tara:strand:- start:1458 stop:2567 length:1110 start_codon:yes stop_codon:yes gene_type:complete
MKGNGKKTILILDFNVVYELLAGVSVVTLLQNDPIYNYEVVFNQNCALEDTLQDFGVTTHRLPFAASNRAIQFLNLIFLIPRIIYLFLKIRPDLVHANNVLAARFGVIFKILFRTPLITHIRNVGLPPRTKWICYFTDRFACVSEITAKLSLDSHFLNKVDVVYDGFLLRSEIQNTKTKEIDLKRKPNSNLLRVGMCSRLSSQKAVDDFCLMAENLNMNSRCTFHHAGGMPSTKSDNPYSVSLALNYSGTVDWVGYIEDISEFWSDIDIAIFPPRGHEAFGRVVAEAMALGIPVISSKCGGPEEIIINGVSGILLDHGDIDGFVEHINRLACDVKLRKEIGEAGRLRVLKNFSIKRYVARLHSCYEQVI